MNHNCQQELREISLKATPTRVAILQFLENTKQPADVAAILSSLEKQSIPADPATVFRIMNIFSEKGLATSIQFGEGKTRYELKSKEDHHHLVCANCSNIEDVEDNVLPPLIRHIEKDHKFLVKHHSLEFFGLCQNCQK